MFGQEVLMGHEKTHFRAEFGAFKNDLYPTEALTKMDTNKDNVLSLDEVGGTYENAAEVLVEAFKKNFKYDDPITRTLFKERFVALIDATNKADNVLAQERIILKPFAYKSFLTLLYNDSCVVSLDTWNAFGGGKAVDKLLADTKELDDSLVHLGALFPETFELKFDKDIYHPEPGTFEMKLSKLHSIFYYGMYALQNKLLVIKKYRTACQTIQCDDSLCPDKTEYKGDPRPQVRGDTCPG